MGISRVQDTSGLERDWKPPVMPAHRLIASKAGLQVYDSVTEAQQRGVGTSGGLPYIDPRESYKVIPPLHR